MPSNAEATEDLVSSLVNTQFQYIDVGLNIEVTPRAHPDGDVSMKFTVEVSSVSGSSTIGNIQEPIISQHKIEHNVRLKDGEVNILGGLIEQSQTNSSNSTPGLASIPGLRYFFSEVSKEVVDDEVLIILTPHILRLSSVTAENLRRIAAGTDSNARVYREASSQEPVSVNAPSVPIVAQTSSAEAV